MEFKNSLLAEKVEDIDSAFFIGECLFCEEDRLEFRKMLKKWDEKTAVGKYPKAKEEKPGRKTKILNASNVEKIEWDESNLFVYFNNGGVYQYLDIPEEISIGMSEAISPGSFLNREIKGKYRYSKVVS